MKTLTSALDELQIAYPEVSDLLSADIEGIFQAAKRSKIPAGTRLFRETEKCKNFMWLLEGSVRVFKNSSGGREITLYRVDPGELCVLSIQSLLSGEGFPAEAIAETELLGLTLTQEDFDRAMDTSKVFRGYMIKELSQRIGDVVQLISEVTFQRLDLRLACILGRLFERSDGDPLSITHAQLARELGTTREVISRILKDLETQECIVLSRGEISLKSKESLEWFSR